MKPVSLSYEEYPATFPSPLQAGYNVAQDFGVATSVFGNGWIRHRRLTPWTYRTGLLAFRIDVQLFNQWHDWAHKKAFKWIEMKVQDDRGLPTAGIRTAPRVLRFTGPVEYMYGDWDYVDVRVSCEYMTKEGEIPQ